MFYCDPCAERLGYPQTMSKSRGRCECCDTMAVCNDRPSSLLPWPKTMSVEDRIEAERAIAELTSPDPQLCACGLPLHYSDKALQAHVQHLVDTMGEFVPITVAGAGTWKVSRHYVALHGIIAAELPGLGFERVGTVQE